MGGDKVRTRRSSVSQDVVSNSIRAAAITRLVSGSKSCEEPGKKRAHGPTTTAGSPSHLEIDCQRPACGSGCRDRTCVQWVKATCLTAWPIPIGCFASEPMALSRPVPNCLSTPIAIRQLSLSTSSSVRRRGIEPRRPMRARGYGPFADHRRTAREAPETPKGRPVSLAALLASRGSGCQVLRDPLLIRLAAQEMARARIELGGGRTGMDRSRPARPGRRHFVRPTHLHRLEQLLGLLPLWLIPASKNAEGPLRFPWQPFSRLGDGCQVLRDPLLIRLATREMARARIELGGERPIHDRRGWARQPRERSFVSSQHRRHIERGRDARQVLFVQWAIRE